MGQRIHRAVLALLIMAAGSLGAQSGDRTPMNVKDAVYDAVRAFGLTIPRDSKVMVLHFQAPTGEAADYLIDSLTDGLVWNPLFITVERRNRPDLGRLNLRNDTELADAQAGIIGTSLDYDVLITGAMEPAGSGFRWRLRTVDAKTGKALVSREYLLTPEGTLAGLLGAPGGGTVQAPAGAPPAQTVPASAPPAQPALSVGDGKGLRIAVLEPAGKRLGDQETWILTLIQGSLTADFQRYTAMTVTDRQNLEALLSEQEKGASGVFSDEQVISIGHLINAQYITVGSLTKLPTGYMLELGITDTSTGQRRASFAPRLCTREELLSLQVVKEAAAELLAQLGVVLSGENRAALLAVNVNRAGAEAALARGVEAQRKGSVVEALANYYEAADRDPALAEARARIEVLSAEIEGGSIAANLRNDMQRRQAWVDLMTECENYFKKSLPWEIVYDPKSIQQGTGSYFTGACFTGESSKWSMKPSTVDYQRGTVDMAFYLTVKPTSQWNIVNEILKGFCATKKGGQWGIVDWPMKSKVFSGGGDGGGSGVRVWTDSRSFISGSSPKKIQIEAALLNDQGRIIATTTKTIGKGLGFPQLNGSLSSRWDDTIVFTYPEKFGILFSSVRVADLTDKLDVKILQVDSLPVDSGYARVMTGDTTFDDSKAVMELQSYEGRNRTRLGETMAEMEARRK